MTDPGQLNVADQFALRRTAELYAQGADRRNKAVWASILAEDCVITGPGFEAAGREANLGSIDTLGQMFQLTRHLVHNQVAIVQGDSAHGETYCTADHIIAGTDVNTILCWHIRYQDSWRRSGGVWQFTRRELVVDWEETRPLSASPAATQA